jgi:hypothetical protein
MSNMRMRQSAMVAYILLALVAAAGCGGGAGQGADDTALRADRTPGAGPEEAAPGAPGAGPEGAPGAPGAPGQPGPGGPDENAGAPGSPITIPAFTQIGGQPVDKVRPEIEAAIREACTPRHNLCVRTVVEARDGEDLHACFGGTRPPTDGGPDQKPVVQLDRDSVLTIYSDSPDCGDTDDESSSSTTESSETTQSSSGGTESSETSQSSSSGSETSDTTQPDAGPPSSS